MKRTLYFILTVIAASPVYSQGMIPGTKTPAVQSSTSTTSSIPVLIGQPVPESLLVRDSSGTVRPLNSYKSSLDVMVVGVFSLRCAADTAIVASLRRVFEDYKDWQVAFVAVAAGRTEAKQLSSFVFPKDPRMQVVEDIDGKVVKTLGVQQTPTFLILDEGQMLRYRGPLEGEKPGSRGPTRYVRRALDAVIGHTEPVPDVEPPASVACDLP